MFNGDCTDRKGKLWQTDRHHTPSYQLRYKAGLPRILERDHHTSRPLGIRVTLGSNDNCMSGQVMTTVYDMSSFETCVEKGFIQQQNHDESHSLLYNMLLVYTKILYHISYTSEFFIFSSCQTMNLYDTSRSLLTVSYMLRSLWISLTNFDDWYRSCPRAKSCANAVRAVCGWASSSAAGVSSHAVVVASHAWSIACR